MEQGSNFFDTLKNTLKNIFGGSSGSGNTNGAKVSFHSSGPSGHVLYESPEGKLNLYYEFGGGDVTAIINVPTEAKWAAATNIPLEKRMAVLHVVGKETVKQQTRNGAYEITDNCILIR